MSVTAKRWSREQYRRLASAGVLGEDDRVQLIRGEIIEMGPQSPAHAGVVHLIADALRGAFGREYHLRIQSPLALEEESEPEPDVAVVPGSPRDYMREQPKTAALVIEVSDTTLEFDRTRKLEIYAQAGIPEYWILNLVDRVLEVYREPEESGYRISLRLGSHEVISPLAAPAAQIKIMDLLS